MPVYLGRAPRAHGSTLPVRPAAARLGGASCWATLLHTPDRRPRQAHYPARRWDSAPRAVRRRWGKTALRQDEGTDTGGRPGPGLLARLPQSLAPPAVSGALHRAPG